MREGDPVFAPAQRVPANASVMFNGTPHAWRPGLTLADVLVERDTDGASVATAVNASFVPRAERVETPLWPDDVVIAFGAIVGG